MDEHALKARAIELIVRQRKVAVLKLYALLIGLGVAIGAIAALFMRH